MTHALNKLLYGESYNINDPAYLDQLGAEIRHTADEIRTEQVSPKVTHDIAMAVDVLMKIDAPPFQKLYPVMEAAAVTEDPRLLEVAGDILESTYPIDEAQNLYTQELNTRSRREFRMALNRAGQQRNFGRAVASAEALLDYRREGDDADTSLAIGELLMHQQDNRISKEDKKLLQDLLRKREYARKRQELETQATSHEDMPDDAVRIDRSELFDDEIDENNLDRVA